MKRFFFLLSLLISFSIGQIWADDVTFNYLDYKGSGTQTSGSEYTMSDKDDVTISDTKFYGNNSYAHFYANSVVTITPAENVTISNLVLTASGKSYNGYQSNGSVTTSTGVITNTDDTHVTWTGSATSAFTISHNKQIRWTSIVVTYTKNESTKTLSSVAVSGTPTKTSYKTGDNFDPAGLTVTGTYSDASTAPITSGITWAYNPSQTLALNQTSIGVTATVSNIASAEFNVTGLSVTEAPAVSSYDIDFESAASAYTDWTFTTLVSQATNSGVTAHGGSYYGGTDGKTSGSIVTKNKVANPGTLTFYISKESTNSTTSSWLIKVSSDGTNWTQVGDVQSASAGITKNVWTEVTRDLSSYSNVYVGVFYDGTTAKRCLDDLSLTTETPSAVTKPTISGVTPFLTSTTVTISHDDADAIYYTTNGDAPTTSSTAYSAPFSLTNTATVKAIAVKGSDESAVAEKTFTKATVMTVAQARAAIDAGGDLSNKYVAGIISQIDSYNSTYNSITYWISDDGTTTDQLEVYSGLAGVVKSAFASEDDLAVGDDVTVKGTLKKYQSTYEFDYNNTIEAYKPIARLAWSAESFDASLEGANTFPTLTNTNGVSVSYSSNDPEKASFADEKVYDITLNAVGSTTITATFAGNETYKANSASYTLNIASSLVTLTYNVDGGEAIDPVNVSALPNPLPTTTKAGKNFGGWFTDSEKTVPAVAGAAISENTTLYAKWLDPYTVSEAKAVIDANASGIANQYVAGIISQIDSYQSNYHSITYWISADGTTTNQLQVYSGLIGNAATALEKEAFSAKEDLELGDEVVVTGTLKLHNSTTYEFDKNNTIYSFSRKASAGLEYAETAIQKTVGDDLFTNPLTNPNSVTVTYSSSDEDVAVVDENTGEVLVGDEGTATITAAFAGNATYKAAEVSYTVTVSAAAPVLTDYYEKVTETAGITDGTYLIVYEADGLAFNGGLETLDAASNTIDVVITNDHKIGVTTATEAATFFIDVTAGSIQTANGKYIGANSYGNRLDQSEEASAYVNALSIDDDDNAVITISNSSWDGDLTLRYNSANNQARFRYYKNGQQPIQLYKLANETVKANPELEWSGDVEITLGETFTAPTLDNPHSVEGITYASDNETLATVTDAGVIELVADATGTAHITASFAGNDDYKAVNVSCTITVNAATPTPTTDNVVILAVYDEKYYAMSTTNANNGFTAIAVEYDGEKVTVKSEAEKTAIQWTRTTNGDNTTFQDANEKYMKSADGASMSLQDAVCNWLWDATGGYYKIAETARTFFFQNTSGGIFKNYATSNLGGNGYSDKAQVIAIAAENIVVTSKADAELAYTPAEVTLTVGGAFTPAVLGYAEGFDGLAAVTYASNNEDVATVDENGDVSLVADAIGTATITATFAGNNNYLAGSASYTITVNAPAPTPTGTTYTKVTSTGDITDGEYLIVYETTSVAFNGALETLDAEGNSVAVVISGDEIAGTTAIDAAVFTIDVTAGTLQSASGKYIGVSSNSNGLKQTENASTYTHTFSIDGEGNAVILANFEGSTMKLRYNPSTSAGNLRFRYYKNDGQQHIQLYKKESATPPTPDYGSYNRDGLTIGNYATICLPNGGTIEGAKLFDLEYYDGANTLYFLEVNGNAMVAGRPYIFLPSGTTIEVTYTDNANASAGSFNGLVGSFTQQTVAIGTGDDANYILYQNAYYLVNSEAYVGANRAYIHMASVPTTPTQQQQGEAPRRRVAMAVNGEQVATGIDAINASDKPMKVMIDGKLYIIRAGQMYDMTGSKVK